MPVSTVGVQCADQGITLNSKELLLAESGSASLTNMISVELSAFMLASVMQSLAPAEQNLPLTKDKMPLHWFGVFITSKQQKWKHNVLLFLFSSLLPRKAGHRLKKSIAVSHSITQAHLVQPDVWKIMYCSNQMDLLARHKVYSLVCLLAISSCYSTTYFPLENEMLKSHTEVGKAGACWGSVAVGLSWEL